MSQETDDTSHLRSVIAEINKKLETRTAMLATLAPYLLESFDSGDLDAAPMLTEFFDRHADDLHRFKEEYGKEHDVRKVSGKTQP